MNELKVTGLEEPTKPNQLQTCGILDKSATKHDVFTPDECKKIIELAKTWEAKEGDIQTKSHEEEFVNNTDYRNCMSYTPPMEKQDSWLWVGEKISETIYKFNASTNGWKFDLIGMAERPMMMEYSEGVGKYDWHIDLGPGKIPSTRKLAYSVILNDDFEGGELQFMTGRNPMIAEQKLGTIIFFPTYFCHRVTLVTKGTRYAMVGWIHGNSFK